MILQRMLIENFRQFFGSQNIEFALGEKNVTLVHGFNGAGKTALLNAFIWCLYGETTPDFEHSERLASEAAIAGVGEGGKVCVRVRLIIKTRDGQYVVERTQNFIRSGHDQVAEAPAKINLSVQKNGEAELTSFDTGIQQRINSLLSPNLYRFFFFNGERVEWLASAAAYEKVEDGLKSLLDIKIHERSLNHLRNIVSSELATELKKHGGEDLQAAISKLEELQAKENDFSEQEKRLTTEIAALEAEKEEFERAQKELEGLATLIQERASLRTQRDLHRKNLRERTGEIAKVLSDNGYLGLAEPELNATEHAVDDARKRGELPAKIKPQFVDDLLAAKLCICGRTLEEHDEKEIAALKTWRQNTGLAEHEEAVSLASGAARDLARRRKEYFERVDELQGLRSTAKAAIAKLDDQIADIDSKLGDPAAGDKAVSLAEQIARAETSIIEQKAELKSLQKDLQRNKEDQEEVERNIKKFAAANQQGELIKRQRATVEKIASALQRIYDIRKQDVRQDLSNRIERLWTDAAIKDYKAGLSDEFQLRLTKKVAGFEQPVHGASTGEKQVLALSFVGSLVEKARENLDQSSGSAMEVEGGGQYPLVMDSAFGSLEDDYRAKVAHWIPKLAGQVVILVSKTQWRDEVENEIRPRIGKEYVLELHSTKAESNRAIDILSDSYPYVVETTDPFEQTKIQLVSK